MSAPFPTPTSLQYQVVVDMVKALNAKDTAKLGSYLDASCPHMLHPASMRGGSNQRCSKDVFIDRVGQFATGWVTEFGLDADHPVNVVKGHNVIVIQFNSTGKLLKGGKDYKQEYLQIVRFNDDNKIVSIDEWLDSALAMKAFEGGVHPVPGPDGRLSNVEEAKKAHSAA